MTVLVLSDETMSADTEATRHLEVVRQELDAVVVVVASPAAATPAELARYSRLIPRFFWAAPAAVAAPQEAKLTMVVIDGTRNWARRIRDELSSTSGT